MCQLLCRTYKRRKGDNLFVTLRCRLRMFLKVIRGRKLFVVHCVLLKIEKIALSDENLFADKRCWVKWKLLLQNHFFEFIFLSYKVMLLRLFFSICDIFSLFLHWSKLGIDFIFCFDIFRSHQVNAERSQVWKKIADLTNEKYGEELGMLTVEQTKKLYANYKRKCQMNSQTGVKYPNLEEDVHKQSSFNGGSIIE